LAATNTLVEQARRHHAGTNDASVGVVLRDELYRVATDDAQQKTLMETAVQFPTWARWMDNPLELRDVLTMPPDDVTTTNPGDNVVPAVHNNWETIRGALRLSNGCKVIHVPSYLRGLWRACETLAATTHPASKILWTLEEGVSNHTNTKSSTDGDDDTTTIFCVGGNSCQELTDRFGLSLPVQLVRGHSVELRGLSVQHAMVSGKYVSPTARDDVTLIGATHDFKLDLVRTDADIIEELRDRTAHLCDWRHAPIHRITCGVRVQSSRGPFGRRPIVGRISSGGNDHNSSSSSSSWIFTGLSSRGLLYHGIYGEKLAKAVWEDNEDVLLQDCPDMLWWKRDRSQQR
jgi:glycine/D-amino acid oxidase-like deaminating enzyme